MSALELFAWCLCALSTSVVTIITVIETSISKDSLVFPACIIAFNIIGGAVAYCLGRQACKATVLKHTSEASVHTTEEGRATTLNLAPRVSEPSQRPIEPDQIVITQDQTAAAPEHKTTQLGVAHGDLTNQLTWWNTISKSENDESKEVKNISPQNCPVLAKAERKEKLAALRAEKRLLDGTEEENWQQSEPLRLSHEAFDEYSFRKPGVDAEAFNTTHDIARSNWSMGRKQRTRKYQRQKRIELDIKALEK
jgi:hypothetical protein